MSSSRSAQCRPSPHPISSQFRSCSAVPCNNLGNHASGTESSRPSSSTTRNESGERIRSTAKGSASRFKVRMPCLQKLCLMQFNQLCDLLDFAGTQTLAGIQCYRLQPELCNLFVGCNVNVWWLPRITFVAEKEKPIGTFLQDCWHQAFRTCFQAHYRIGECRGVEHSRMCA